MIPSPCVHKRYIRFVRTKASTFGGLRTSHRHFPVWRKLRATNLEAAWPFLARSYARNRGRPARCPLCLLRSCLAMMLCGVTSFDKRVALMWDEPFYAFISGFSPDDLPGVGTFYDFLDRLLQRPRQGRTTRRRHYRHRDQRDHASQHRLLQTHTAVATAGSSFSSWLPCASTLTPGSSTS